MTLFAMLLIGHALADYPLQGDYLARAKNRHDPAGANFMWLHALAAHSMIHAGFVWGLTGLWWLGCAEFIAHAVTDFLKTEQRIGIHTDQAIHVACKVVWAIIALQFQ